MYLLAMHSSPVPRYLVSPTPKYLSPQPFSTHTTLCFSLNVRDQVSRPYKITNKVVLRYILILIFLVCGLVYIRF